MDLITVKEAAKFLSISQSQVRTLCLKGKIRATREFGRYLIDKNHLERKILESLNKPSEGELKRTA